MLSLWTSLLEWWRRLSRRKVEPFDFTQANFPRIDVDKEAEYLRIDHEADRQGQRELPPTTQTVFSGTEQKIVTHITGTIEVITANARVRMPALKQHIREFDPLSSVHRIQQLTDGLGGDLDRLLRSGMDAVSKSRQDRDRQRDEFQRFRSENKLVREPVYPSERWPHYAWLLAVLVFESIGNSVFFYQTATLGITGGVLYAAMFAAIDVVCVSLLGRGVGCILHVKVAWRVLGVGIWAVLLAWIVGFNLFVAHFRDKFGAVLGNLNEAAERAQQAVAQISFQFSDPLSWGLLILGVVLSGAAAWNASKLDDLYPGYGRLHKEWQVAEDEYRFQRTHIEKQGEDLLDRCEKRLQKVPGNAQREYATYENNVATYTVMQQNLNGFKQHWLNAGEALLQRYRSENMQHRTTPTPEYFQTPWSPEWPDELLEDVQFPPEPEDEIKDVNQQVSQAVNETTQRYEDFLQALTEGLHNDQPDE
jgi:hypothetical protein